MRAKHTAHPLPSFPVCSSAFISDDELVLGGGGGATRSGIKNKLRLFNIKTHDALKLTDELELEIGEDAPMSMAAIPKSKQFVCGINSAVDRLSRGENENCRVYSVKEDKITLVDTQGTLLVGESEDYQKVTAVSPDGSLLAVAGNRDLAVLSYPALLPVAEVPRFANHDIYDATFSSSSSRLVVATTVKLYSYRLPPQTPNASRGKDKKGKQKAKPIPALELEKTVELPSLPGISGGTFRAARSSPTDEKFVYSLLNVSPVRKSKGMQRQVWVCMWNSDTWEVVKKRKVADKWSTCFDISPDGKLLAYGLSDCSIGVLDAHTLSPLLSILKAHDFPPTTIRFNPTTTLLMSGSADNSIRVVSLQGSLGGQSWATVILFLITVLILLVALAIGSRASIAQFFDL